MIGLPHSVHRQALPSGLVPCLSCLCHRQIKRKAEQTYSFPRYWPAGELDFQADEAFLEAVMTFALSVPTADVVQDAAWDARQRRLLSARFGPQEVVCFSLRVHCQCSCTF